MPKTARTQGALTVAGSDSSGGAGIAADLKTFAAFGVHGFAAITAVTAQTAQRVQAIHRVPVVYVEAQIGMLGSAPIARATARTLREMAARNIVLDPVLASSSGTALLPPTGLRVLREELVPMAALLTPNLPEAEILLGRRISDLAQAACELRTRGARAVLLKGGHGRGREVYDVLADKLGIVEFRHPRLPIRARGTGCALSSAIAAGLAHGRTLREAVADAEAFVQHALAHSYRAGNGSIRQLGLSYSHV